MEDLQKRTLAQRSEVMDLTLRWNPEKFQNGHIIPNSETVSFFEAILNRECTRLVQDFLKLLACPMTTFMYLFHTFDLDFLILAFEFYQCKSYKEKLCEELLRSSQRTYISVILQLKNSTVDVFKQFGEKVESIRLREQEEMDNLVERLNKVEVVEKTTFAVIYKNLPRN